MVHLFDLLCWHGLPNQMYLGVVQHLTKLRVIMLDLDCLICWLSLLCEDPPIERNPAARMLLLLIRHLFLELLHEDVGHIVSQITLEVFSYLVLFWCTFSISPEAETRPEFIRPGSLITVIEWVGKRLVVLLILLEPVKISFLYREWYILLCTELNRSLQVGIFLRLLSVHKGRRDWELEIITVLEGLISNWQPIWRHHLVRFHHLSSHRCACLV